MANDQTQDAKPAVSPASLVKVTFLFRDVKNDPIEGLSVQFKAGTGTPPAPPWATGPDPTTVEDPPPAPAPSAAASAPGGASAPAAASTAAAAAAQAASGSQATAPAAKPAPPPPPPPPVSDNTLQATSDKDGYAVTITNAARNQPIDVFVKNRRGEYTWKVKVIPKKDISAFVITSPEYHLDATTQLSPKEELEQDLSLPVLKEGEVMTIERLVNEFGPYIGWVQKVTEQGRVKKDFPTKNKEVTVDAKTHKKKTKITIEHHYKVINTGKPQTVVFNVLGSRLNYPKPEVFSEDQYKRIASELGVEVAAVKAIAHKESKGNPFLENGLPPILYERRHFFKLSAYKKEDEAADAAAKAAGVKKRKKIIRKKNLTDYENPYPKDPELCFPSGDTYGAGSLNQYQKLIRAAKLDFEIALQACSWGAFQILGEYYSGCGFSTVFEFVDKFMSGVDGQVDVFIRFLSGMKPDAVEGLKTHNWEVVATSYNGGGWKKKNPTYATDLGKYYAQFK
ncbi:phage-encoded peptidoglycan binding protein [Burkholderia lata]|nr:phage-encoded peptidoglycan binding protein [Burkholderia lata]